MATTNSSKRPLPCDFDIQSASKAYCSEFLDFSDSEAIPQWLEDAGDADLELDNHFTVTAAEEPLPRWPLEQPEKALTFSVLNTRPDLPEPEPLPLPELVEEVEVESATSDDEFFDYDSLDEPILTVPNDVVRHLYRFRQEQHARSWDNDKLTTKRVRAAWSLIGPYAGQNREASFEQVLLTAHSLNNTSLLTGLARQTMAPEATY